MRHPLFALAFVSLLASPAFAQNAALAESLFREARASMKAGHPEDACPKFAESYRLDPAAGTLLNLGLCEEQLGHVATAWTTFRQLVDTLPANDERALMAQARIAEIEPKVPRVHVTLRADSDPNAVVSLDDVELRNASLHTSLAIDPGSHTLTIKNARGQSNSRVISLALGESLNVELSLPADTPAKAAGSQTRNTARVTTATSDKLRTQDRPKPLRIAGFTLGGIGLAGLGASLVFGGLALDAKADVGDHCPGGVCDSDGTAALNAGKRWISLANISAVVGAVGLVSGGILLWQTSNTSLSATASSQTAELRYRGVFY